jgi:hypothetical protein
MIHHRKYSCLRTPFYKGYCVVCPNGSISCRDIIEVWEYVTWKFKQKGNLYARVNIGYCMKWRQYSCLQTPFYKGYCVVCPNGSISCRDIIEVWEYVTWKFKQKGNLYARVCMLAIFHFKVKWHTSLEITIWITKNDSVPKAILDRPILDNLSKMTFLQVNYSIRVAKQTLSVIAANHLKFQ